MNIHIRFFINYLLKKIENLTVYMFDKYFIPYNKHSDRFRANKMSSPAPIQINNEFEEIYNLLSTFCNPHNLNKMKDAVGEITRLLSISKLSDDEKSKLHEWFKTIMCDISPSRIKLIEELASEEEGSFLNDSSLETEELESFIFASVTGKLREDVDTTEFTKIYSCFKHFYYFVSILHAIKYH
jgi:hypothetical protein